MSNRKYGRPVVKQVSKRWVRENCNNLTDRDIGLLQVVYNNKLLRRDQIEVLYPKFPSTDYLNKRLKMLYDKHLIDRVYPPLGPNMGTSKQHVCLDRAGFILLDKPRYNKPIQVDSYGNKSPTLGWSHIVALNDYQCRIRKLCESHGLDIVMLEIENPLTFRGNKIIPDIFLFIKSGAKGQLFFIECDLGTEDLPYVKKKFRSYIDYYISKLWVKLPWARVFKTPIFPQVVFLTEEGRNKRVETLSEISKDLAVKFHVGFHSQLEKIILQNTRGS